MIPLAPALLMLAVGLASGQQSSEGSATWQPKSCVAVWDRLGAPPRHTNSDSANGRGSGDRTLVIIPTSGCEQLPNARHIVCILQSLPSHLPMRTPKRAAHRHPHARPRTMILTMVWLGCIRCQGMP